MRIRILLFLLLSGVYIHAQGNIFNVWYFGQNSGLDFNGPVTALSDGRIDANEGTACISDASGSLLFYTDGVTIWDRTHDTMPNGMNLTGHVSTTQSAMIVQLPGSTTLYYVFTVPPFEGGNLSYSIVDMTLNGGLGDVVLASKNTPMPNRASLTCEKITTVKHCNGIDWWIITHDIAGGAGSSSYRVWLFSAAGVNATPVVSSAGTTIVTSQPLMNQGYGWLTATHDGKKLVSPFYGANTVDIVDFDNATGIISNPLTMNGINEPYGTEFSPNDQVLYVSAGIELLQFDFTLVTAAAIQASQIVLDTDQSDPSSPFRAVRMAPDGKMYISRMLNPYLSVINFPDVQGTGCGYDPLGMDVDTTENDLFFPVNKLGLPNTYKFGNPCTAGVLASFTPSQDTICANGCITFTDNSSGAAVTGWSWQFEGGTPGSFSGQNPGSVCFSTSGPHNVTLTVTDGTSSDDTTMVITVNPLPVVSAIASPSSAVCEGDSVTLSGSGASTYTWNNGVTNGTEFLPTASLTYTVTGTDANSCQGTASITIQLTDCSSESIGVPEAFSPNDDGNNDMLFVKGSSIQSLKFMIYNRYGQKVFESESQATGWDGKFNGKEENPGVFVWVVEYTFESGSGGIIKGNTTLIR